MSESQPRPDRNDPRDHELADQPTAGNGPAGEAVELHELVGAIWSGKWFIVIVTMLFAAAAVAITLSLPDLYRADALLTPAEEAEGGGISALASQFGGLATLAGVQVPADSADNVTVAMEIMKSRTFVREFIDRYDLMVPLMAVNNWDPRTGELSYDADLYDAETGKWVREVEPPRNPAPSHWEAYKVFRDCLNVTRDNKTGLIRVSMEHYSPELARNWVDRLVLEINRTVRDREVKEAEDSVRYLHEQLEKTAAPDMKKVFYQLIEEQTKTIMLSAVRDEYVFKTVDAAVIPEEPARPRRLFIVMVSTLVGALLATLLVLTRRAIRPSV